MDRNSRLTHALVQQAALTRFQVTKVDERRRRVQGAVYQAGKLVAQSQRVGGIAGDLVESSDPLEITGEGGFDRISGRWLYGGHWMGQFGHFVTETLTTLWPRIRVDGIICHPFIFDSRIQPWQTAMVRRLGFEVPVIVARQGCVVEELIVPERPFTLNNSARPEAVAVWDRVASESVENRCIFLSRSNLATDPRLVSGDGRLDNLMASRGFTVLHPQDLSIEDQLDAVAGASILAGLSGSALHLSAFAPKKARVIEIGDPRSSTKPLPNQRVIDGAIGRRSDYIPFLAADEQRDLAQTDELLSSILTGP